MSHSVAVIGSGLSAIGAVKALIKKGIVPTVIDVGETLDPQIAIKADVMSNLSPNQWSAKERKWLSQNNTLDNTNSIPKKMLFGSDYFYGSSCQNAPIKHNGNIPPFSYALGGFSVGWGAAVLPPQPCDISDWPVDPDKILDYCKILLAELPYSACDDGLSKNFPMLSSKNTPIKISKSSRYILECLNKYVPLKFDNILFGQARLLVEGDNSRATGCRYCGQCMSGCVYKSIYKSGDEIVSLHSKGKIAYLSGCWVDRLSEVGKKVKVHFFNKQGESYTKSFDKVFVAAGAVNSTRIAMNSLALTNEPAVLKTRAGFIVPVFSLKQLPLEWPNCNTQPGLFLEIKGDKLPHWVHVQISTENELMLEKLKMSENRLKVMTQIKRYIAKHVFLIFVNYHSDHAGTYELRMTPSILLGKSNQMISIQKKSFPQWKILAISFLKLFKIFIDIKCLLMIPFAKINSGTYHVGCTLPMRTERRTQLDTDSMGKLSSLDNVHFVDTSVFPSLPGTTIGLLAMANAYRIVDTLELKSNT
ncbi:MAG: hypothetical protein ACYDBP_13240 [Leptospirales bacterium]